MNESKTDGFDPVQFGDDESYLLWARANPDYFVLTANKSLTPSSTVVHYANCRLITELSGNAKPGGFTRSYIKVGAANSSTLYEWAKRRRSDAEARQCTACARNKSR